jgi:hypothetical protein
MFLEKNAITGIPTPNCDPSLNFNWMCTGAPAAAGEDAEGETLDELAVGVLTLVLAVLELLPEVDAGLPLPPEEVQAASSSAALTSRAPTAARWRGRGVELGFVTPPR